MATVLVTGSSNSRRRIRGMGKILAGAEKELSGKFLSWDGAVGPW